MASPDRPDASVFVALLAGGRGTRFWPLSRSDRPKQFLDVTGHGPLLSVTRERVAGLCPPENVLAVTTRDLAGPVRRMLGLPPGNVVAEPSGRNTAPAVGLALVVAAARDPDAVVLALPADHHVTSPARLRRALRRGVRAARRLGGIVLFGAVPGRPATEYGYLELGEAATGRGAAAARRVKRFREKPDPRGARRLVARGALWNSGMFCLHAATTLEEVSRVLPALGAGLEELRPHVGRRSFGRALGDVHPRLPAISFDHGVLERSDRVHALPLDAGWSDVGTWESAAALWDSDRAGNSRRGEVVLHDARGCIALQQGSGDRTVVLMGTRDLVVVDTPDAVLVCPRDEARDVPGLLSRLRRQRPDLLKARRPSGRG